jgi:hypothetical protein
VSIIPRLCDFKTVIDNLLEENPFYDVDLSFEENRLVDVTMSSLIEDEPVEIDTTPFASFDYSRVKCAKVA